MSDKIQLHSLATPNGVKVSVALEEMGLPYEAHLVDIMADDQFRPEFMAVNPNSKIPAIHDPKGPDGKPFNVFESGAILHYLAQKAGGKFMGEGAAEQSRVLQWLFFQVGSGPYFGQLGHFTKYSKEKIQYCIDRYVKETKHFLKVIDTQLQSNAYIAGDKYSIADMALFPWIACLDNFYNASELLGLSEYKAIDAWMTKIFERPAVKKGIEVCVKPGFPKMHWK